MKNTIEQTKIIKSLKEAYKELKSKIIIIEGENGVGKTYLINNFLQEENINPVYYFANDEYDKSNRDSFRDIVLKFNELPCFKTTDFSWELSFKCLMGGITFNKRVIIIEDSHNLIQNNKDFIYELHKIYIEQLKNENVLLIITSELYGNELKETFNQENYEYFNINRLSFEEFKNYYNKNQEQLYTLTNGLFTYMKLFNDDNYIEKIKSSLFNSDHYLFNKPFYDLTITSRQGLKKQLLILKSIVKGNNTLDLFSQSLSIDKKDALLTVNRLIELGIVENDLSINGLVLSKNYKTRYIIKDSFLASWLKLNYCHRGLINREMINDINIDLELENLVQETYIKICYQYLKNHNISYQYSAKYYDEEVMVDLVSVDIINKKIIIGDCKLLKAKKGLKSYNELIKAYKNNIKEKYENYSLEKIVLFNENGFTNELINFANTNDNVILLSNKN